MIDVLKKYRERIISEINAFFKKLQENPIMKNFWYYDIINRMYDFVISGKMLRGALVMFSESMFSGSYSEDAIKCAITIELLQSGLLIHDDIMDEDIQRRGRDSIFFQYKKIADEKEINNSYHIGESMGICAGNFAFSLAFISLSNIKKKEVLDKIVKKFGEEMAIVGIGQMEDVITSGQKQIPSEEEIVSIYKYKTARYSFSLPFSIGAILSKTNEENISLIEEIGEYIGIIFQIQDDKLGLLGDSKTIGKPRGSDIKENKKTLFYLYLMHSATKEEKEKISKIFGNQNITDSEIDFIIHLLNKYNIFEIINKKLESYASIVREKIFVLPVDGSYKTLLLEFVEYNLEREK